MLGAILVSSLAREDPTHDGVAGPILDLRSDRQIASERETEDVELEPVGDSL